MSKKIECFSPDGVRILCRNPFIEDGIEIREGNRLIAIPNGKPPIGSLAKISGEWMFWDGLVFREDRRKVEEVFDGEDKRKKPYSYFHLLSN